MAASRGARQKQVCDIDAGEQEYESDRAKQNKQRSPDVLEYCFLQGRNVYRPAAVFRRKLFGQPLADRVRFRLSLRERYTGIQPAYTEEPMYQTIGYKGAEEGILNQRNPDFLIRPEYRDLKPGGHNADDGKRPLVQHNRPADEIRVAAKPGLP